MKHHVLLLAISALLLACGTDQPTQPVGPFQPPPPLPTFVVFGVVEDDEGGPLRNATAELIRTGQLTLTSTTNDSGFFSFGGVRGPTTLRVSKLGYVTTTRFLEVTESVLTRLTLARLLPDAVLTLGVPILGTVQAGAPPCDPGGWDANAPCRRFRFIAPATGTLRVVLTWEGEPELDAVLVVDGGYVASSDVTGVEQFRLEAPVVKGTEYELRVNSYYGTQEFELKADLIP